jgi:uncharacterized protein YwbE
MVRKDLHPPQPPQQQIEIWAHDVRLQRGRLGNVQLVVDGYTFNKHRENKSKMEWYCSGLVRSCKNNELVIFYSNVFLFFFQYKCKCRARLSTARYEDGTIGRILSKTGFHNHGQSWNVL